MYLEFDLRGAEIEREREVIREEIMMYRDNPAQHAQELLSETMWPRHPLGQPLTGTVESIAKFTRPMLMDFMARELQWAHHHRHGGGQRTARGFARSDERADERACPPGRAPRYVPGTLQPRATEDFVGQPGDRADAPGDGILRLRAVGRAAVRAEAALGDPRGEYEFAPIPEAAGAIWVLLFGADWDGGALGCRGDQYLRWAGYGQAGESGADDLREIESHCNKAPARNELRKAQDYTVGQTLLGMESTTNQMMFMGESILGYRKVLDPADIEARLMAVTAEDVRKVACHCLDRARLGLAVVGPLKNEEEIRRWVV